MDDAQINDGKNNAFIKLNKNTIEHIKLQLDKGKLSQNQITTICALLLSRNYLIDKLKLNNQP